MHSNLYYNFRWVSIARKARMLTQVQLAKKVGITQGTLSKIENGYNEEIEPYVANEETIIKIAKVLNFPRAFFNQIENPVGLPVTFYKDFKEILNNVRVQK